MAKVNGHGQAAVLTGEQINLLFTEGLQSDRDRALFGILLYCGCRVSEGLALTPADVTATHITLRKSTTKGQRGTRQIDIHPTLACYLAAWDGATDGALFPGRHGRGRMTRAAADLILKDACKRCGLEGVSTHSFRRTALTQLHNAGVPLRVIQSISGHASLASLQRYLEVAPQQVSGAISALSF
jgi:integrase/recombinase XerD